MGAFGTPLHPKPSKAKPKRPKHQTTQKKIRKNRNTGFTKGLGGAFQHSLVPFCLGRQGHCEESRERTSRLNPPSCRLVNFSGCLPRQVSHLSGPMRDTPPYRAIPFRDSIAEGGIAAICLVFIGYRGSIAEIPFLRWGIAPLLRECTPRGKRLEKREGVSHPIGHVETPKTP